MAFILFTLGLSLIAGIAHAASASALSALHRRTAAANQVAIACYTPAQAGQPCGCPIDLNYNEGVLINFYPGYQCAYPVSPSSLSQPRISIDTLIIEEWRLHLGRPGEILPVSHNIYLSLFGL